MKKILYSNPVPFKFQREFKEGKIQGWAAKYGEIIPRPFNNVVMEPGLFGDSIRSKGLTKIPILWQHDERSPIGKTLGLREDGQGLYIEAQVLKDDIAKAKEAFILAENDILGGWSVGFDIVESFTDQDDVVHYTKADLWEVSLVTFPASSGAEIDRTYGMNTGPDAREHFETIKDFEKFLRDAGMSRKAAVAAALHGYEGLSKERDASDEVFEALSNLTANIRENSNG